MELERAARLNGVSEEAGLFRLLTRPRLSYLNFVVELDISVGLEGGPLPVLSGCPCRLPDLLHR
jgi:hypothetical protein